MCAKYVVVADIADFFSHLYLHPIERVLDHATQRAPAAYCILRFIRNWNAFVSYGVPVGLSGSRVIAEAVLAELDRSLLGLGRKYCRYSDDIRIFCKSERDARKALEDLAMILFETQGLTLQPMKTLIVSRADYLSRFSTTGERIELESLTDKLHDLLEQAGWENDYEDEIDLGSLPEDIREEIDRLANDDADIQPQPEVRLDSSRHWSKGQVRGGKEFLRESLVKSKLSRIGPLCNLRPERKDLTAAQGLFEKVSPILHHLRAWLQIESVIVSRTHFVAGRMGTHSASVWTRQSPPFKLANIPHTLPEELCASLRRILSASIVQPLVHPVYTCVSRE